MVKINYILKTYKSQNAGKRALEKYFDLFPLSPNRTIAGLVGDLFSDGHLQGSPKWRIDFTSKSKKELRRFGKEMKIAFGVKGKIRKCSTNKFSATYNYGVNNKPIARILFSLGVPAGSKVLQSFVIPDWILGNRNFFTRFAQRLFDCEGTIDTKNRYIEISMYKSMCKMENCFLFFRTIKQKLMEYYGIETTNPFTEHRFNIRKDGIKTKAVKIKIKKRDSLIRFHKFINFETKDKKDKLNKIINKWDAGTVIP